jgi:hypothetical protein
LKAQKRFLKFIWASWAKNGSFGVFLRKMATVLEGLMDEEFTQFGWIEWYWVQ